LKGDKVIAKEKQERVERAIELHNIGYDCQFSGDYQGVALAFGELVDILTDPKWLVNVKEIQESTPNWNDKFDSLEGDLLNCCARTVRAYDDWIKNEIKKGNLKPQPRSKSEGSSLDEAIRLKYIQIKYAALYDRIKKKKGLADLALGKSTIETLDRLYKERGDMYAKKGDTAKANADYQRAINFSDPANQKNQEYLRGEGITQQQTAETLNAHAQEEFNAKHYEAAAYLWEKAGNTDAMEEAQKKSMEYNPAPLTSTPLHRTSNKPKMQTSLVQKPQRGKQKTSEK